MYESNSAYSATVTEETSTMAAQSCEKGHFNVPQMIFMVPHVLLAQDLYESQQRPWNPEDKPLETNAEPSEDAKRRMCSDIRRCYQLNGCHIASPEDKEITKVHAIIVGPQDTPYEGGFFHFLIRFPFDYPEDPPKVKLLTTGNGTVRFNPNFYRNGKVCMNILGTWLKTAWTPGQTLDTVLDAIQRIVMNKEPYNNEPWMAHVEGESERYNEIIYHETLRVAVCGMLERPDRNLPKALRDKIEELFLTNYDFYMRRVQDKMVLDGTRMMVHDCLETGGSFAYRAIRHRLEAIHRRLSRPKQQ